MAGFCRASLISSPFLRLNIYHQNNDSISFYIYINNSEVSANIKAENRFPIVEPIIGASLVCHFSPLLT